MTPSGNYLSYHAAPASKSYAYPKYLRIRPLRRRILLMDMVVLCQLALTLLVLERQLFLVGTFYVFRFQAVLLVFRLYLAW